MFPIIVGLLALIAGCAGATALVTPAKTPMPGNRRDEKPVGDEYSEQITQSAKSAMQSDGRFRVHTLFSPSCPMCGGQRDAAMEAQAKKGAVDLTVYNLNAAAGIKDVAPLTIIQYSDCKSALAVNEVLDSDSLVSVMNYLKDSCENFRSIPFGKHQAPIVF